MFFSYKQTFKTPYMVRGGKENDGIDLVFKKITAAKN